MMFALTLQRTILFFTLTSHLQISVVMRHMCTWSSGFKMLGMGVKLLLSIMSETLLCLCLAMYTYDVLQMQRLCACEYMCDMFSHMEDEHLDFVRKGKAVEAELF